MKQAYKTLFFFVVLPLAIYYVPRLWQEAPDKISQFFNSSQMANITTLLNNAAEKVIPLNQ